MQLSVTSVTWSPPPPVEEVTEPAPAPAVVAAPTGHGRDARGRRPRNNGPKRASSRLAEKNDGAFVAILDKAIKRKAIKGSLEACSDDVRKHVKGRKLLKRKNPLGALDLSHLGKAAGLSCSDRYAVAVAGASTRAP